MIIPTTLKLRGAKRVAAHLPEPLQVAMKILLNRARLMLGKFRCHEPEWRHLDRWVSRGDVVLDIGANVGWYALRLSDLVGERGKVYAFEPVRQTMAVLRWMAAAVRWSNIELMPFAVSDSAKIARISVPSVQGVPISGLAKLGAEGEPVECVTVDQMYLPRLNFVKIDIEGHELAALRGMRETLIRCRPTLVVEDNDPAVGAYLAELGYSALPRFLGSPNVVYMADHA